MPEVSVIVPVYNVEQYLCRCIDSILAQTFCDIEVILIDDGSKDTSGSICDRYAKKDSRVTVIHKENEGVSVARNCGLAIAKGKYIMFCDSDDYVETTWVEKLHYVINSNDVSIAICLWNNIQNDKCVQRGCLPEGISSVPENFVEIVPKKGKISIWVWHKR